MRSRRTRRRYERVIPKPDVVIEEQAAPTAHAANPVSLESIEPSKARERVTYVPSDEDNDIFERVIVETLDALEIDYEVELEHGDYQRASISIGDSEAGALIGRRGAGIDALETLISRMSSHQAGHSVPVQVDVNEYRSRHEQELREDAVARAKRVLDTGQDDHLQPMNPRDRRVVHLAVQEMKGLDTYSLGHGSSKHIVIHPTAKPSD